MEKYNDLRLIFRPWGHTATLIFLDHKDVKGNRKILFSYAFMRKTDDIDSLQNEIAMFFKDRNHAVLNLKSDEKWKADLSKEILERLNIPEEVFETFKVVRVTDTESKVTIY